MKILLNTIFVLLWIPLIAQKDTTKLNLNQVEVIKSFEVILEDAQKLPLKSVLPPQKDFSPKYKYDITIVPLDLKYPEPQIKPLAMDPAPPFKVNNGYLYAGYGIRKNPDIQAGYFTSKKDSYDAAIQFHFDALDNSSVFAYQKYRNAGVSISGSYLIRENLKLYGGINTSFNKRYFYHTDINVDSLYTEAKSTRTLNGYNIFAGIKNAEMTKFNINYDLNLALRGLNISTPDIRENGIALNAKVEKIIKNSTVITIDGKYDYTAFNGTKELSLSTAQLVPTLKTNIKKLFIQAGANLLYSSDGNSTVFPEVNVSYGIAGNNLQLFAGVHQNYYTNNYTNITQRNPYLSTAPDSLKNTIFQEYSGGVKGKFSFLSYQIKAGWKNVKSQMFLINNKKDIRYFDMIYDDTGILFLSGNIDFSLSDDITLGGWINQNFFSLNTFTNAWHTPKLEANIYAKVLMLERKFSLQGDLYYGTRVPFITKEDVVKKSNILFDLNLTAEYNITEKFRFFVRGINLLNNKFERYYGYPSVGINGMLGIKVVF